MSKNFPIPIGQSATLFTQPAVSLDDVPDGGFVKLRNWRRSKDQLLRMEGWVLFEPDAATGAPQSVFDGTETLLRLAELMRPNGERVVIGASRTLIKKFDTTTWSWVTIGSGYSAQGKRWQPVTINGYLVLNNAVDLPVSYRVEDATVTPVYEMREVGIASVGRIAEYDGFLFVADITEIKAEQLNKWMNGYPSYVASSNVAKVANFSIVSGDTTKQFDVTTGPTDIVATLPSPVANPNFWVWIHKADADVGIVSTSPETAGDAVSLESVDDIALVWSDGSRYVAKVFAGGVIPATDPYGIPPASITNRLPYAVAWSEFGQPTRWAPLFDVYMTAASATLVLPFPSHAFIANQTKVAVINGGADNGTLGGQSDTPDGVLVTAVAGSSITLAETTDTAITYPRTVQVTRFSDVSTLVGRALLQGDGSPIIGMLALQGQVMLYRTSGIYTGRFTGDATNPFIFKPIYSGYNVPLWGDCIASINGEFHLYPGVGGRFYSFDGATQPGVFQKCDDARDLFFAGVLESDECWAIDNCVTKQWFFCRPGTTFCFDYEFLTVGELDSVIDAAAYVHRPGASDMWFILAVGRFVYTFGLVTGVAPISTFLRNGVNPGATIKTGLITGSDTVDEKDWLSLIPVLASPSPDAALEVQIASTWNPSVAPTDLLIPVESLPSPAGDNLISLLFRAIYMQVTIELADERDIDVRFSELIWELDGIRAGSVPRKNI